MTWVAYLLPVATGLVIAAMGLAIAGHVVSSMVRWIGRDDEEDDNG